MNSTKLKSTNFSVKTNFLMNGITTERSLVKTRPAVLGWISGGTKTANPAPMLRQLALAITVLLLGFSLPLQAKEKNSNKKVGSTVTMPSVGTRFNCRYELQYQHSLTSEAGGKKLPSLGRSKSGVKSEFSIKVLGTSKDRIEKVSVVLVNTKTSDIEVQKPDGNINEFLKKMREEEEKKRKTAKKEREEKLKTVFGKTFIATFEKDSIKLEDMEGKPAAKNLINLIPVPADSKFALCGLNDPAGKDDPASKVTQLRLFHPSNKLVEALPWKGLTKVGESAEFSKETASAMIKPGPGWKASSVKVAQLIFLEQKDVGGVDCKRFKFTIKANGPHGEPLGGLPSKSTIAVEAEITLESETGWVREFILSYETMMNSEGYFQTRKKMKMDAESIVKVKIIITPNRQKKD